VFCLHLSIAAYSQTIEKLAASVNTRQVQQGKSITVKGDIYYQRNGNMVTHFSFPREVVILANKLGETRIYDPLHNTVLRYQNEAFSTQSTQMAYFLNGNTTDMGLPQLGFVQDKTYHAQTFLVTEWKLKTPDSKALIQRVKLVYDKAMPIYMHYTDASGKLIRKVFYYNYQLLANRSFPTTTTEILYSGNDSTVSKTTYGNFQLNTSANSPYFNFMIPANAKNK